MTARRRLATALALLLGLAAAGCHDRNRTPDVPPPAGIDLRPQLQPFTSCDDLEATIEDALVLQMRASLEQGRFGWYPGGGPVATDGAGSPVAAPSAGGPTSHSTTTTQVEGVGEADFVQNDGTRQAVLANGTLHLLRSWPPRELSVASSTRIEGWAHDLFFTGDQVVVFSAVYQPRALEGPAGICPMLAASPVADFTCGYEWQNTVKITTLDVADLAAPRVVSEVYLPGSYVSARQVAGRVRLVLSDALPFPAGVRWWPEQPFGPTEEERRAAFAALADANEAVIRARTLDDWLRRGTVKTGDGEVPVGYACGDFAAGAAPVRPGLLTVATFDPAAGAVTGRTTVFGEAGVVYASAATLWVATPHWWWWPEAGQRDATYLHAFDLADPARAGYLGSATVDGIPRDQYALDEHEGALRIATTVSQRVPSGDPWGRIETAGRVSVLKQVGGAFEVVGETPPFGAGERVFGTRFLGDRGYVITAEQIDPLFALDLSDPTAPTVMGEVVMPGFLAYLHPVDATHLLGVGQDTASAGGRLVKLTLLDVADLLHPAELATVNVGNSWSWTEAIWDPKAFTFLPERGLLAIPLAGYDEASQFTSDLRIFKIDPAATPAIAAAGRLSMADVYLGEPGVPFSWWWSPYVRRSVLASDPSGDYVYAVSDAGVRAARLGDPVEVQATVTFPPIIEPQPVPLAGPVATGGPAAP